MKTLTSLQGPELFGSALEGGRQIPAPAGCLLGGLWAWHRERSLLRGNYNRQLSALIQKALISVL